eukprot:3813085-Ditylum_brightwellii.AAC.1
MSFDAEFVGEETKEGENHPQDGRLLKKGVFGSLTIHFLDGVTAVTDVMSAYTMLQKEVSISVIQQTMRVHINTANTSVFDITFSSHQDRNFPLSKLTGYNFHTS